MKLIPDLVTFEAEVLNNTGTVLVDFYSDNCAPCRMMTPVLEEVSKERTDLKVVKVDAATNFDVAVKFGITAVPTFLLIKGGQICGQFSGTRSKRGMLSWIDSSR